MKTILFISSTITLIALGISLYLLGNKKKTAYVDNVYLFDNCSMKKELDTKFENDKKVRKTVLDSLNRELVAFSEQKNKETSNIDTKEKLNEAFYYKRQKYDEELRVLSEEYNTKVWNFINQKMLEYGKANNYDYLFGANGQGSLMFANEKNNITEDVLTFINSKYEGN